MRRDFAPILVLIIGLTLAYFSHTRVIAAVPFKFNFEKRQFILKPQVAKAVSLGFIRVFADINWLAFVQYYGDPRSALEDHFAVAPTFLKLVVKLEPHFMAPYWFASFILAGEMKLPDQAAKILDEGIQNNPKNWNYYYIAGFNQYMYGYDKKKARKGDLAEIKKREQSSDLAAEYYERGAKLPSAPEWLGRFAKIMRSHALDIVAEIKSWQSVYRTADNTMVATRAADQIQILDSLLYYKSPSKAYKDRALRDLKEIDRPLLPEANLPTDWEGLVPK